MRLAKEKPQSPCSHGDQPVQVAHPHRVIEAELGAQRRRHLGRDRGVGGQLAERIARRQRQHA